MKKTALITGASKGIGKAFAQLLAKDGWNLILVARSEERLQQLRMNLEKEHGVFVQVVVEDLTHPDAPRNIFENIEVSVDLLINNAGMGEYGEFENISLDRDLATMDLNMRSLTEITKWFVPAMIERGSGQVLNVASVAAFQPGPGMAIYFASKAYVLSFSEALAEELRPKGITVSCLCPGYTQTEFFKKMEASEEMKNGQGASPVDVARYGLRLLEQKRPTGIYGWSNRIYPFLERFISRALVARLSGVFLKRLQSQRTEPK